MSRTRLRARLGAVTMTLTVIAGTTAAISATQTTPASAGVPPTPIVVNTTLGGAPTDDNLCSLREAIGESAGTPSPTDDCTDGNGGGNDVIQFALPTLPATIDLTGGSLSYDGTNQSTLTIEGPAPALDGTPQLTIDGTGVGFSIFFGGDDGLDVSNVIIQDGSSTIHGGAIMGGTGDVTATNVRFLNNSAAGNGGAILGAAVSVVDSVFTNNHATGTILSTGNGGAITATGAVSITNTDFTDNTAVTGGAVGMANSSVTVSGDSDFTNNTSTSHGGAIHSTGFVSIGGTGLFSDNDTTVDGRGGAIDTVVAIVGSGVDFSDNDAVGGVSGNGGCIFATQTITVNAGGSEFTNNSAQQAGGCLAGATITVTGATFKKNKSTGNRGGAIIINGSSNVSITGSTFGGPTAGDENTAAIGGGAIATIATPTSVSVTGSTFIRNQANSGVEGGGAIEFAPTGTGADSTTLTVDESTFTSNGASGKGGAIYANQGTLTVTQSTFAGNVAGGDGGGVAVSLVGGTTPRGSVKSSTFFDNETNLNGSAIYVLLGVTDFPFDVSHVTASNNEGDSTIANVGVNLMTLFGTIIEKSVGATTHCVGPITGGGRNIWDSATPVGSCSTLDSAEADPQIDDVLGSNGGPTQTLRPTTAVSPAVDQIPPADCAATTEDQRKLPRPVFGSCDIGAVEVQPSVISGTVKDLPAPKGTGAAFGASALSGVGVCPTTDPTCTPTTAGNPPSLVFADAAGAYSVGVEPGIYAVYPFYCKSTNQASCTWTSPSLSKATSAAATPVVSQIESTVPNVNVAGGFRPDVKARKSTVTSYTDSDAYTTTAQVNSSVKVNGKATFIARLENDGTLSDKVFLKSIVTGSTKFTVKYFNGSTKLLNMTTDGKSFTLAPGATKDIKIELIAQGTSTAGSSRTVRLKLTSTNQGTGAKVDYVEVKATRS